MIELVLVFLLGFASAVSLWLMLLPAFWRRTERITRATLERAMPISQNEIIAERDLLRAEKSVAMARADLRLASMQKTMLVSQAELGEGLKRAAELNRTVSEQDARIRALLAAAEALNIKIAELREQVVLLETERDTGIATIKALELHRDGLAVRLASTIDVSETHRIAGEVASLEAERVRAALAEQQARNADLLTELQDRDVALREAERKLDTLETQRLREVAQSLESLAQSKAVAVQLDAPQKSVEPAPVDPEHSPTLKRAKKPAKMP